jgi:LAO/AO transport system kinase
VATQGTGMAELRDALERHRIWLEQTEAGRQRRVERLREAMRNQLRTTLLDCALLEMGEALDAAVGAVARREIDPYRATDALVESFRSRSGAVR